MPDDHLLDELLVSLEQFRPGWKESNGILLGPGTLAVLIEPHKQNQDVSHMDVVFALNRDRTDVPDIRDCVSGIGSDPKARAEWAIGQWAGCTAPVIFELLERGGKLADHFGADHPDGIPGWHTIHGPIRGWGVGEHLSTLQQWVVDNPLLPQLKSQILPTLAGRTITSVRFFFGGDGIQDVAEVMINGNISPAPSRALEEIKWPRPPEVAYIKIFMLVTEDGEGLR